MICRYDSCLLGKGLINPETMYGGGRGRAEMLRASKVRLLGLNLGLLKRAV